jgi:hypothetical protein
LEARPQELSADKAATQSRQQVAPNRADQEEKEKALKVRTDEWFLSGVRVRVRYM